MTTGTHRDTQGRSSKNGGKMVFYSSMNSLAYNSWILRKYNGRLKAEISSAIAVYWCVRFIRILRTPSYPGSIFPIFKMLSLEQLNNKYTKKNTQINKWTLVKNIDPQLAPTTLTQESLTRIHRSSYIRNLADPKSRNAQNRTPVNSGVEWNANEWFRTCDRCTRLYSGFKTFWRGLNDHPPL